jgi:hypothetical protein
MLLPAIVLAQAPRPVPAEVPREPHAIPLPSDAKASSSTEQWFTFGPPRFRAWRARHDDDADARRTHGVARVAQNHPGSEALSRDAILTGH